MAQADAAQSSPPSLFLAMSEGPRAAIEFGSLFPSLPWLMTAPKGDGHPVMVLPGFSTTDRSTKMLRSYFDRLGFDAHAWELGRNLGPRAIGREGEKLVARLEQIFEETGQKVSLVGWSLGGMMARQLARRRPEMVRQVITLGSPIQGSPRATSVWRLYEFLTGQKIDAPEAVEQLAESELPMPVRSTAIFSKADGIVAWQNCTEPKGDLAENIEVYGSHCGLGFNASVLFAVADRLAQGEGEWVPFDRGGMKALLYPAPGKLH